ncbi:MAG: hypothetical protein A2X46_01075 [Lentisphaerae bacterium GWF2_57_35]|nr:MAG: hypothetical protein A2X46_01075 [Lentisphaerae bacterium GWF2_57_35]
MDRCKRAVTHDLSALSEDMRDLMSVTADIAGDEIQQVRRRLSSTLASGKEVSGRLYGKAAHAARTAGLAVREHPYQSIGVALAVSALMGTLWARRSDR